MASALMSVVALAREFERPLPRLVADDVQLVDNGPLTRDAFELMRPVVADCGGPPGPSGKPDGHPVAGPSHDAGSEWGRMFDFHAVVQARAAAASRSAGSCCPRAARSYRLS